MAGDASQTTDESWKDIRPFLPPVGERLVLPAPEPAMVECPTCQGSGYEFRQEDFIDCRTCGGACEVPHASE